MKKCLHAIAASLLIAIGAPASANVVLDGGPAFGTGPVNATGSFAGSVVQGGQTGTYASAAASAGVQAVYFGLWSGGGWGFSGDGPGITGTEAYRWHADTGNTIEYRGQTSVPTATGGAYALFTRLLLTAVSGATVVSDPVTQALAGDVHSLLQLTGGTFVVTREVELSQDGTNWFDARPFYDGLQFKLAGNSFQNSLSTGFYWQNTVQPTGRLPEPGTLLLVASCLVGLGALRRARTR